MAAKLTAIMPRWTLLKGRYLSDFLWHKLGFNHLLIKLLEKTQFTEFWCDWQSCFRTLFLRMFFRRTECCNFVHNSTPYIHPRSDSRNWPRSSEWLRWSAPLLFAYGIRDWPFGYLGGGGGAGFLSKKIFWFLICKKKIKWLKRGTKRYYGLKNSEKKNSGPIWWAGGGGRAAGALPPRPPSPLFHVYTFWNQKLCIYNFLC